MFMTSLGALFIWHQEWTVLKGTFNNELLGNVNMTKEPHKLSLTVTDLGKWPKYHRINM